MNMPSAVKNVGVIGAGRMGQPIVGHLVRKGFAAIVHDVDAGKRDRIESLGARWVDTPAALTRQCQVILICVGFDREVRDLRRRAACCLGWHATQSWPCSRRSTRGRCRTSLGSQRSLGCMLWIPRCAGGAVPRTKARYWPSSADRPMSWNSSGQCWRVSRPTSFIRAASAPRRLPRPRTTW